MRLYKYIFAAMLFSIIVSVSGQNLDTSYQNMVKRLKVTVPYSLMGGGGFGYKFYLNNKDFERLWTELVPDKPDANYSSFSNLGFELEASIPISANIAAGVFFNQAIKTITANYNKTTSGETINYFGKDYYLAPGTYNNLKAELGLGSINIGVNATYFSFKKGALGLKYISPFVEIGYGITFIRGKFIADPFGEIDRFSKANPVYISLAIGSLFSSYTYWAGISFKLRAVYSEVNEVLRINREPLTYKDGSVFKARLSNFGIALIGNYVIH